MMGADSDRSDSLPADALSAETLRGQKYFRVLAEAIPQQVWTATPGGQLDFVNREVLDYLNGSAEAVVEAGWFDTMHPEDRAEAEAKWQEALDTGEPFEAEFRLQRGSDETYRWFLSRAEPMNGEDGGIARWFGTNTDITEQKEEAIERARLTTIVDNTTDFVGSFDVDGKAIFLNTSAREMWGASNAEDARAKHLADFHPEEDRARIEEDVLPAVREEGRWSGEMRLRRLHSEDTIPVDADLFVTRDPSTSEAKYIVAVYRDITPYKEAKEKAQQANRAKSQFLANMSHELRTPLNAVIGYSEMIREDAEGGITTEEAREQMVADLDQIHTAGKQLLSMVNDVLDISKIEAGEMKLNVSRFDVQEMVEAVAATVRPLAEQNDNRLEVECPPDVGTIRADLTKLRQGFFNLLGNAAKFTEGGRITLRVRREEIEGQPGFAFEVEDTGVGMSEEDQEKIFEAFSQADTSLTREHEGAGLGLVITRNFMKMMGGTVDVESEEGAGSTFTMHLPAEVDAGENAAAAEQRPAEPETMERGEPTAPSGGPSGKAPAPGTDNLVLIIDDDARARELVSRHLRKDGFAVATAASGEEGLAMARELKPTVITLDVMMPRMDGWTVLSMIQDDETLRDIPVVMVTIVDEEEMGYVLGASEYLTKPLNAERLASVLHRYRSDGEGGSVLVVEDDAATRELIHRTLDKEEGYDVREARNGREALERLDDAQPEVILLDLMMPEMDGFTFLEKMHEHREYWSIPVIVVTAKELTQEDRQRLNENVEGILQKGNYRREDLLEAVSQRVRRVAPGG